MFRAEFDVIGFAHVMNHFARIMNHFAPVLLKGYAHYASNQD